MALHPSTRPYVEMLRKYGFDRFEITGGKHVAAYHPKLAKPYYFPGSPSDAAFGAKQAEGDVRRMLGMSNQGRAARVGERKPKRRHHTPPKPRLGPAPPHTEVADRHDQLSEIDRLMRGRP